LVLRYNPFQRESFASSINDISGFVYEKYKGVTTYFNLKDENSILLNENANQKSNILKKSGYTFTDTNRTETIREKKYQLISSRIINLTVNRRNNYFILDKGRKDGVEKDMGVIGSEGIAGIIISVSQNYSSAISILNTRTGISAKISENGYLGIVVWDGIDYKKCTLKEIPDFVELNIGDSVLTSGYSSIFPENELIGIVNNFKIIEGSGFQDVELMLSTNFKKLYYVYIIKNNDKDEIKDLEKEFENVESSNW